MFFFAQTLERLFRALTTERGSFWKCCLFTLTIDRHVCKSGWSWSYISIKLHLETSAFWYWSWPHQPSSPIPMMPAIIDRILKKDLIYDQRVKQPLRLCLGERTFSPLKSWKHNSIQKSDLPSRELLRFYIETFTWSWRIFLRKCRNLRITNPSISPYHSSTSAPPPLVLPVYLRLSSGSMTLRTARGPTRRSRNGPQLVLRCLVQIGNTCGISVRSCTLWCTSHPKLPLRILSLIEWNNEAFTKRFKALLF